METAIEKIEIEAREYPNGAGVITKMKKSSLAFLEWQKDVLLTLITCLEHHPNGRDEQELYRANLTLRLVENEIEKKRSKRVV